MKSDSGAKAVGKDKIRRKAPIKIVLRRLPGGFTWEQLRTQLEPLPETEFLQFVPADSEEEEYNFARAYFVFKNDEDIVGFRDRFNGYVFVDSQGLESVGLVELAPNPKVARHRAEESKKRDRRCSSIEADLEFKQFLDEREHPAKQEMPSMEERVKEVEEKERSQLESIIQETPLTQFMIRRSDERFRRQQDKRRIREEERRVRLQRLFEKEQKERAERKEAKKITEFRNSKVDPSLFRDSSHKENKREKEQDGWNKDEGEKEPSKRREEQDKPLKAVEKRPRNDVVSKKERESSQRLKGTGAKDREAHTERSVSDKAEKVKNGPIENGAKAIKEKLKESEDDSAERTAAGVGKDVGSRTAAAKENTENAADSLESAKKPRRNKDRPERAIYQPSAARRRMAALGASTKGGDGEKKSQKAEEVNEKR